LCNSIDVDRFCFISRLRAHRAEKHLWKGEAMTASRIGKGLAGAAAMAAGSQAYGVVQLIATPPDVATPAAGTTASQTWNADGVGGTDFTFQFRFPNTAAGGTATGVQWQSNMNPAVGNAVLGFQGPFINYATNLTYMQPISSPPAGATFRTAAQVTLGSVYVSGGVASAYGGFGTGAPPGSANPNPGGAGPQAAEGYVGFRIGSGPTARFGWLQLRTSTTFGIDFIAAALGGVGDTVEAGVIPEPASLGLLALGATALLRRKH
jgi:hypothetical protein